MPSPPWFRFYSEALTDRKIQRVCRATEQPKVIIIGAWTTLLALANDSPVRGILLLTDTIPYTIDDLADEMGLCPDSTQAILTEFQRFNMIHSEAETFYLTNWNGRQFESDSSTARVQRYRQKQRALQENNSNVPETLQDSYSNLPEQNRSETDTDQSRADIYAANAAPESPPSQASADYQEIRQAWITLFPDKPKPRTDNQTLQAKVKTRLKSKHFRDNWRAGLERASRSSFLLSEGFFDLGWYLKNDNNWEKCFNGNYDNRAPPKKAEQEPGFYQGIKEWYEQEDNGAWLPKEQ